MHTKLSFSELVAPCSEAQFTDHFRNRSPFFFVTARSQRFEQLLNWEQINELLSHNLLDQKRLRVSRDGRDVPPALYRKDSDRNPVDLDKVASLMRQNCSLAINRVQDLSPAIWRVARQIEARLDAVVNVNAYLSFGAGGAFAMHYDPHDVLVLQIYGNKRWFLFEEPEILPTNEEKAKAGKPRERRVSQELVLEAGNVLFVPRGMYHRAEVTNETSVHLTFGIHTIKAVDFIDSVREALMQDPLIRADIDLIGGGEALATQEAALKSRISEIVFQHSLEALVAKERLARHRQDRIRLGPAPRIDEQCCLTLLTRQRGATALAGAENVSEGGHGDLAARLIDHLWLSDGASVREISAALNEPVADVAAVCESLVTACIIALD